MSDESLREGTEALELVLGKAVDLWIRMIEITRSELGSPTVQGGGGGGGGGGMLSFVFTENERLGVWRCERHKNRAKFSPAAQGMLKAAARKSPLC